MDKYNVIGIMSGTSLDGLDVAFCHFSRDEKWDYNIIKAETLPYDDYWKGKLSSLEKATAEELAETDIEYGRFIGKTTKEFIEKHSIKADFVASHGHTIFHQPDNGFTFQLGNGAAIATESGLPVVCDFRTSDVALGGQGAPLVPIGDKLLFSEYDFCLNLGGIANISFEENGHRFAFDICFCNMALNYLAAKLGHNFDQNGELSSTGNLNNELLKQLSFFPFFDKKIPKTLGKEHFSGVFLPIFNNFKIPIEDKLCNITEHVAIQIAHVLNSKPKTQNSKLLITGGGTYNKFLIERIKAHASIEIVILDKQLIEFKEALIFALLGVLRWRYEINCLKSVTGAKRDNIGGAIYLP